ncbi:MAG: hypothetical protein ACE5EQ_08370 [Phycisphaerae bacterium]
MDSESPYSSVTKSPAMASSMPKSAAKSAMMPTAVVLGFGRGRRKQDHQGYGPQHGQ